MDIQSLKAAVVRYTGLVLQVLSDKVDKVEGKQLSSEDFTTAEKTKLSEVKTMAMRDLHVSTERPTNDQGNDGDIWIVLKPQE